jgi:hypothetical protein
MPHVKTRRQLTCSRIRDAERQSLSDSSPPRPPFKVVATDDATIDLVDGVKRGLTAMLADNARLFVNEYFHRLLLPSSRLYAREMNRTLREGKNRL